jgi:heat-inducible transcriptional repressor
MDMNKRHKLILETIVSMYINSGEPIASGALRDALSISVSSATIRNEMARLTKLGYLNQPHVSSGRVPTNKAYRYYVENIDRNRHMSQSERLSVSDRFDDLDRDSQRFLPGAARLFSQLTGYAAVIVPPHDRELQFSDFTYIKTGKFTVALVATTSRGAVVTRVIRLGEEIGEEELKQMETLVNSRLRFICYRDIDKSYLENLSKQLGKEKICYSQLMRGTVAAIKEASAKTIYVAGQENLASDERFGNDTVNVLRFLADINLLKTIIAPKYDGVSVVFGDELGLVENMCIISAKYHAGSSLAGAVTLVCPRTVDYKKIFPVVDYFAALLTKSLTGIEGEYK